MRIIVLVGKLETFIPLTEFKALIDHIFLTLFIVSVDVFVCVML